MEENVKKGLYEEIIETQEKYSEWHRDKKKVWNEDLSCFNCKGKIIVDAGNHLQDF